jgi:hypothetical protein
VARQAEAFGYHDEACLRRLPDYFLKIHKAAAGDTKQAAVGWTGQHQSDHYKV